MPLSARHDNQDYRSTGFDSRLRVGHYWPVQEAMVVVHGWDIAAATGHDYACEPELLQAAYAFVQSAVAQNPKGSPGLFGPPIGVPDNAPLLDRLIGLAGRDPDWRPDGK